MKRNWRGCEVTQRFGVDSEYYSDQLEYLKGELRRYGVFDGARERTLRGTVYRGERRKPPSVKTPITRLGLIVAETSNAFHGTLLLVQLRPTFDRSAATFGDL